MNLCRHIINPQSPASTLRLPLAVGHPVGSGKWYRHVPVIGVLHRVVSLPRNPLCSAHSSPNSHPGNHRVPTVSPECHPADGLLYCAQEVAISGWPFREAMGTEHSAVCPGASAGHGLLCLLMVLKEPVSFCCYSIQTVHRYFGKRILSRNLSPVLWRGDMAAASGPSFHLLVSCVASCLVCRCGVCLLHVHFLWTALTLLARTSGHSLRQW